MTALINELAAQPGSDEVALVLDDYHLIGSQPVHASLGYLLDHRPPGLHPMLPGRPPLALARLRPAGNWPSWCGRAAVHRRRRAAPCSRSSRRLTCPMPAIAALGSDRTEGWAAGLAGGRCPRGKAMSPGVAAFTAATATCSTTWPKRLLRAAERAGLRFLLGTISVWSGCPASCRRGDRPGPQPALLEQAKNGPVPAAPGSGARLVALSPPVRRTALRPPAGRTARRTARLPNGTRRPGKRAARAGRRRHSADAAPADEMPWAARIIEKCSTESLTYAARQAPVEP